jgi:dipeptidyl aminopeptidase/acylaminoacyl peptidase
MTPTLFPTNTPFSENKAVLLCPPVQDQFPDTVAIQGNFILDPLATDTSPYLLDFSTGSQSYLPFTEASYPDQFKISPNYQWVAYFTKKGDDLDAEFLLVVTDVKGNVVHQESMDRRKKWFFIDTWLDNQTLMLERYQTVPSHGTLDTPLPVTLFNPFTSESRDMDGDFPNMLFFFEPLAQWDVFGKSGTAYDPTVSLVAYASDSRDDHRQSIVLWDINSNQEITRIQAAGDFGSGPVWSPDGSQFILDSLAKIPPDPRKWTEEERLSEEIFSVSRTGEITRLTFLTEQFQEVSIDSYRWSPDGRYIAFDVLTKPDIDPSNELSGSHSAILDTHTKEIRIYCYKSYPGTGRYFWSPDGTSLLTGIENPEKADAYSTILIDLISNVTVKVADETIPVGWIIQQ